MAVIVLETNCIWPGIYPTQPLQLASLGTEHPERDAHQKKLHWSFAPRLWAGQYQSLGRNAAVFVATRPPTSRFKFVNQRRGRPGGSRFMPGAQTVAASGPLQSGFLVTGPQVCSYRRKLICLWCLSRTSTCPPTRPLTTTTWWPSRHSKSCIKGPKASGPMLYA